ncbi:hypothetical protein CGZ95_08885 [Enemella evansiae]|uniref:hypothetical protein n=1 Tax=Enemella evansiae TaxID=2016499 RepID=UPI000B95D80D|nr:hypothetical protein [Enemella evansiae]OYO00727.1 hypothetical protein CGZ95_08885 [Enemella evansiae]
MKRITAALPVVALALVLTGCGSGGQATETESTENAAATETATPAGPPLYALSVQAWSPYLEKWTIDGQDVTYEKVNCLGQSEETTGTWGEKDRIEWNGPNPLPGAGPTSTTSMTPLTDDSLSVLGAREAAVPDVDGQTREHVKKCKDAGETVGKVLLG